MKKLFLVLAVILTIISCQKEPLVEKTTKEKVSKSVKNSYVNNTNTCIK